jgi:phage terminase large subunit GpA-like protein
LVIPLCGRGLFPSIDFPRRTDHLQRLLDSVFARLDAHCVVCGDENTATGTVVLRGGLGVSDGRSTFYCRTRCIRSPVILEIIAWVGVTALALIWAAYYEWTEPSQS